MRPSDPPKNMQIAMIIFAFLCIAIGVFPGPLYDILPFTVYYEPYTADHLVTQFQLLLFAGLAFFLLLPMMKRTETISLDFDWFYRKLAPPIASFIFRTLHRTYTRFETVVVGVIKKGIRNSYDVEKAQPKGYFARLCPTETMVAWVAILLAACLTMYYL